MDDIYKKQFIHEHLHERGINLLPNITNIIAVSSGKGGVGKSTVAVNLALALQSIGMRVGILDADIYGPSIPKMLRLDGQHPNSKDGRRLEPLEACGLQVMSMGLMVDNDTSMSWRGPMVTLVLQQLLRETNWSELDYLIVDMPPGTGDIPITMANQMPLTGVVLVTTPQDVALIDVLKGLKMYRNVGVPVFGAIENMSVHVCSDCGKKEHIFGKGASIKLKEEYGVDILGSLPLDASICEQMDNGTPVVMADPDGYNSEIYLSIAKQVVERTPVKELDEFHANMLKDMESRHKEAQEDMDGVIDQGIEDKSTYFPMEDVIVINEEASYTLDTETIEHGTTDPT